MLAPDRRLATAATRSSSVAASAHAQRTGITDLAAGSARREQIAIDQRGLSESASLPLATTAVRWIGSDEFENAECSKTRMWS